MRDKVLSKIIFCEYIILGVMFSILCLVVIEEYFIPGTLEPFARFGLALVFFLCGFGITKCVKLLRQKKSLPTEQFGVMVYKHGTGRKGKEKLKFGDISSNILLSLGLISLCVFNIALMPHENQFTLPTVCWVLLGAAWVLRLCRLLFGYWGYEPRITVALYERKLNVFYPTEVFSFRSSVAAFSLDDIVDARILTAEDPVKEQNLFVDVTENRAVRAKFFLSNGFPFPEGHQAVDLKHRNGRHVLIETDDAENFLAALKENGVGGV